MIGVLGHDSAHVRLYWANHILGHLKINRVDDISYALQALYSAFFLENIITVEMD